ncbi:hypothetical protein Tco_1355847 [Tanacetum coccineum]
MLQLAAQASKEAVWLKMLLKELGYKQEKITLFCENQSALYLARNLTFHSKTKNIRVQYHFVREKVIEGTVDMQKIHIDEMLADYLMKAINGDKFICFNRIFKWEIVKIIKGNWLFEICGFWDTWLFDKWLLALHS